MSKAIINGETWRARSASHATHGSRRGTNLLGWDKIVSEVLSLDEQRDCLIKSLRVCEQERALLDIGSDAYEAAGSRISSLCNQLRALKAKGDVAKRYQNVGDHLISIFKERVTPAEWKLIVAEAQRRHDKQSCLTKLEEVFTSHDSEVNHG